MDYTGARFPIDIIRVTLAFAAFGQADYTEEKKHRGVDLAPHPNSEGKPIYIPWTSKVVNKGYHETAGNYISAINKFPFDTWARDSNQQVHTIPANTTITQLYYHMEKSSVWAGNELPCGGIIGSIGSTGKSTGPHVHMEIRIPHPLNPKEYILVDPLDLLIATIPGLHDTLLERGYIK